MPAEKPNYSMYRKDRVGSFCCVLLQRLGSKRTVKSIPSGIGLNICINSSVVYQLSIMLQKRPHFLFCKPDESLSVDLILQPFMMGMVSWTGQINLRAPSSWNLKLHRIFFSRKGQDSTIVLRSSPIKCSLTSLQLMMITILKTLSGPQMRKIRTKRIFQRKKPNLLNLEKVRR